MKKKMMAIGLGVLAFTLIATGFAQAGPFHNQKAKAASQNSPWCGQRVADTLGDSSIEV